jgi:hypothetical protein
MEAPRSTRPATTPLNAPAQAGDNNDETPPPFGYPSWDAFYASLYGGGSSGGGGTFTGETKPQRFAREAAARGAVQQAKFLTDYLASVPTSYEGLISGVGSAFAPARTAAETAYTTALTALQGRRTQAQELLGQGQTALSEYLRANPQQAFATAQQAQAAQLAPDAVARYAAAIGAPTAGLGAAAVEAAVGAQGAVDAYNRMLQQRQASEGQQNASRLAELEMLKNVQAAGLEGFYGTGAQQLEAQRQAALSQIAQQEAAKVLSLQEARAAEERRLRDALAAIYGTGSLTYTGLPTTSANVLPDLSGVDFAALGRLIGGR